MRGSCK